MKNKYKILIIDDEDSIRKSFLAHFEDYEYEVCGASNGKEGIDIFNAENPDLVVTDMRMPVMDGIEVLKWFKENRPQIPIIIVSGAGDINLVVDALHLGAWDYIFKPVSNLSVLTHAVVNALEKAELHRENQKYREHLEELVKERTEELNKAYEALSENEKRYRLLADNVADVIWLRDLNNNLIYISPSVTNLTGYAVDEYLHIDQKEKFSQESLQRMNKIVEEEILNEKGNNVQSNREIKFEIEIKRKDMKTFWIENNVKFVRDEKGHAISLLGISRDITERKKYEDELKIARDFAEENDRLKTAFLNNMSHEIRTPLNVIQGYIGLLNDQFCNNEEMKTFTAPIQKNSDQLLKIIDDILNISIIETGQLTISKTKFNINELIERMVSEYLPRAFVKKLVINITHKLENSSAEIFSDSAKIRQIFNNLLTNAIKYTEAGYINVGAKKTYNQILFSIKDTGIGIEEKYYEKIFERFQRIEPNLENSYHSVTHGGTGLGLAISKGLVEILGGKIWLESEVDKGSTFYFTIPYKNS
jgi:PAS domain S-box-containing protein